MNEAALEKVATSF